MDRSIEHPKGFRTRHVGSVGRDIDAMLSRVGCESLDTLVQETLPAAIRYEGDLPLPEAVTEPALLSRLRELAARNQVWRNYIGLGYSGTITPGVILRNVMENPGWYTQYTPYQAEIAQGRLEALLNFQTMVIDLTGLEIANASLLDEATAAAEAMTMLYGHHRNRDTFLVAEDCHPQTIAVVETRAAPLGIRVRTMAPGALEDALSDDVFGILVQYPATDGAVRDYSGLARATHEAGGHVVAATDLLALCLLTPPGEWGADVAVGSSQRFGVPMGYGGPHAAFLSCKDEFKRKIPGRIIGVSVDTNGNPALRMALQTREQHIRREKATSNICTAQV
ncbi:MAG: glycine dehydrogenase (aminomethyl-transferring), partial [Gemmatimonadetes bacterium]|nr:glycine dehydrogenase (aminomethyl-transferring) [Gemmatimonadota bacterium]